MKKRTIKRKNILSALVVLVMAMALLLTACGSSQATSNQEETTEPATSPETEVVEEVAEPETETEVKEEVEKVVQENEEEPIETDPYAEIDMESTLPGIEWMQTFDGIIEEPKLVVFNDSTNKKVILEELQEVEFCDDDTLAVYIPKGRGNVVTNEYISGAYEEIEYYDNIVTLRKIPSIISRGGYSSARLVDIEFDGEPMTLYCYLKLMGNP